MSALRKQKQIQQSQRRKRQQSRLSIVIDWKTDKIDGIVGRLLDRAAALAWLESGKASVSIHFVDADESQQLNREWREKDKPTNVLSFPFELPEGWESKERLLGDLVICPAVLMSEATEQGKPLAEHATHLVVHGLLHLQGYDHESEAEAVEMEALETKLLAQVGIKNPYSPV
jgi:probable rRNA maturation factor